MRNRISTMAFAITTIMLVGLAMPAIAQLLLDDSLQGSTSGVMDGGSFVSGGWQVTGEYNSIFWHLPRTVTRGAAEFYVTGLTTNYATKTEHFHMYDYTYGNSDYNYNGGYRENPYKHFVRKTGADDPSRTGSCEIVFAITPNYFELDTANLSWVASTNYKMRVEWGPEGSNSRFNVFRDGANILSSTLPGVYAPTGHSVRIGCSPRRANEGSEIGAKYSYLKVWDTSNYTPSPPTVTTPANGSTNKSNLVYITWNGDSHTHYQVRICSVDSPDSGIVWDSGEVASNRNFAWTGALANLTNYYVYVRIGNSGSWSGWSASGRWFRVDNSHAASNNVKVSGRSYEDANGPFLGLGFTFMASMWLCKNDRANWQNELAYMSARGFNYQRILSEVPGACSSCYWWGRAINASNYTCGHGVGASAWGDYDQQLKDCIDIAYDNYGIRTEITIFGGAGESFPNYAGRQNHCQRVLNNLPGREHKVILIEVANEAWQTGFGGSQGIADLRSLGQYLADRTFIPIALTAMCSSESDMSSLVELYSGSAADVTTEHFSRDLNRENHWYCVRDCWRVVDYAGLPPASSNEPIGPGSSVNTEDDPIHLVSAAAFAYVANLHSYVWHSRAGVRHDYPFGNYAAVGQMQYPKQILPPDVSSWIRNDGKESAAPFTAYCNGAANTYWTDNSAGSDGCHRNIGGRKGIEFVCYPQGIRSGGLTLVARQQVTFKVYNPLTGDVVIDTTTKNTGEQLVLPQGPQAYIIKGAYGPILPGQLSKTLVSKGPRTLTIDGGSSDWNLTEYTTLVRGGQTGEGDIALVGFNGSTCYFGSYAGVLPTSAADHTAKVYSRNDPSYLYFLIRCDDSDMRYSIGSSANWQNDCVELYLDPGHDGGATTISNSSSDIQLVIDANNQKNVYMCTSGYTTQIMGGVTSAVVRDGTGWWLEARISKTALDPDIVTGQTVGLDFNFRDNDNNNDAALTTIYTWNDSSYQGFPSKIPNNWGDLFLDNYQTPYSGVIAIPGIIQAENYDVGGEGISYHDTTTANEGGAYRTDGVDIEPCSDTGGGYNIGYTNPSEWLEYTVNVATSGDYNIKARVANGSGGDGNFRVLIDGSDVTGAKTIAPNGGWQTWTSIIAPARYLTAGQHILRFLLDNGSINLNYIQVDSVGVDAVSVDLGSSNLDDGMNHISTGDGNTSPATIGGHYCRTNTTPGQDSYMYFNVSDAYAYQGSKPSLDIIVEYYDTGTGYLMLHYDSIGSVWTDGPSVNLTNSNTWKTFNFHVNDAYFGNRENYGADFRIARSDGATFYLDTITVGTGPADTTPPGNVMAFTATRGDMANTLSWTNPTDPDLAGVKIMFKTTGYPTGPGDGAQAFDGLATGVTHGGLTNGVTYYYKAYAHDSAPNYASGAQANATPIDLGPPANVTGFTATAGDHQVALSWTNPATGSIGTKIVFKTSGYPTGHADGTQIYNSSGASYTHTGLTNGQVYFYKAFARDEIPNYASGVSASAVPMGPVTISYSPFDADAHGWALTTWKFSTDPTVIPVMAWTAGVGNPGGAARCIGSGQTDNNDRCLREGGEMAKTISTVGYHGISVSYDLKVNSLGGDYTGAGINGACAPDHNLVDEQLTVFYSTNGGSSWTEAEYILRATLLASYQSFGRRTINLASVTAADDNPNFALRLRWQLNHTSDIADLDNITVTGIPNADTTPPAPASAFTIIPGDGRAYLSWTKPGDADLAGVKILFKTSGYPTGPEDGSQCYSGLAANYTHTSLTNGLSYYYRAYAYDQVYNYSTAVSATAAPIKFDPAQAKILANTTPAVLTTGPVSAVWTDSFYAQCAEFPLGVKVVKTGHTAVVGQLAWAKGTLQTDATTGEKYLLADWAQSYGSGSAQVYALPPTSLGGSDWRYTDPPNGIGQKGIGEAVGPNNIGLLVYTWGVVTQRDPGLAYMYVDDGSGLLDGTTTGGVANVGVRVKANPTSYSTGTYLIIKGISSCFKDGGILKRQVLPVTGGITPARLP